MSDRIHYWRIDDFSAAYATGSMSPVEAAQMFLERRDRLDPVLNAYKLVDRDGALAAAAASERRWRSRQQLGPMDGICVSIKDMINVGGLPTRRGSKLTEKAPPAAADAPAVARLREAGAIILGKTNTSEFGWKGTTDSPLHGITRNPWNTDLTPGGSSGGAAAATAAGLCTVALATDGGGSIRNPAGFTNLTGIKATYGRVPAFPPNPIGSLANVGPLARNTRDLATMLNVIAAPDSSDWDSLPIAAPDYRSNAEPLPVAGLRVGFSRRLGYATFIDPEVDAIVTSAVARLEALGAVVTEIEPDLGNPADVFGVHWQVGVANAFASATEDQLAQLDPGLAHFVEIGRGIPVSRYLAAQNDRIELGRRTRALHRQFDLLALPTTTMPAFPAHLQAPEGVGDFNWHVWTPFSFVFNLTRQPAMSVPAGFTADGRPVGLQLVGDFLDEEQLITVATALEAVIGCADIQPTAVS